MAGKRKFQVHQAATEQSTEEEHEQQQEDAANHVESEPTSAGADGHTVEHYEIQFNDKTIACERRRSSTGNHAEQTSLIFTHGAGGGLTAPATRDFSNGFSSIASVVSFQGPMNLTSRIKYFHAVLGHTGTANALGGRSMGARAAVITATKTASDVKALILVSYPLVGGKKKDVRDQILLDLPENLDVFFIIGSKDTMCPLDRLNDVREKMAAKSWLLVVIGANHTMALTSKDEEENQAMREKTGQLAAQWLAARNEKLRYSELRWEKGIGNVIERAEVEQQVN